MRWYYMRWYYMRWYDMGWYDMVIWVIWGSAGGEHIISPWLPTPLALSILQHRFLLLCNIHQPCCIIPNLFVTALFEHARVGSRIHIFGAECKHIVTTIVVTQSDVACDSHPDLWLAPSRHKSGFNAGKSNTLHKMQLKLWCIDQFRIKKLFSPDRHLKAIDRRVWVVQMPRVLFVFPQPITATVDQQPLMQGNSSGWWRILYERNCREL